MSYEKKEHDMYHNLKEFSFRVRASFFTSATLVHVLNGIRPILAPNTHWGRIDTAALALLPVMIVLLSSVHLSSITQSVFAQTNPLLSKVSVSLFRDLFPIYRTTSHYIVDIGDEPFSILQKLKTDVELMEQPSVGPLIDKWAFAHFKSSLLGTLEHLLASSCSNVLVTRMITVVVCSNTFLEQGPAKWSETSLVMLSQNTDSTPLRIRKVASLGGGYFSTSGETPIVCFYLYELLFTETKVKVGQLNRAITAPSFDDVVVLVADNDTTFLWNQVFMEPTKAGDVVSRETPPHRAEKTNLVSRIKGSPMSTKRGFSTSSGRTQVRRVTIRNGKIEYDNTTDQADVFTH